MPMPSFRRNPFSEVFWLSREANSHKSCLLRQNERKKYEGELNQLEWMESGQLAPRQLGPAKTRPKTIRPILKDKSPIYKTTHPILKINTAPRILSDIHYVGGAEVGGHGLWLQMTAA